MRTTGTIWHALAAARAANLAESGAPLPVPGARGVTRRAVIAALAAAAGTSVLPRGAHAAPIRGKVAIVGGGIAGLTALWHLTEAGVDAHLYEARPRIGGRMYTLHREGLPAIEMGGQLVNTDHADIRALCGTFGLDLIDRKGGPHRTAILSQGAELPRPSLPEALRAIAAQIGADAARLDQDYAGVAPELDRLSFTDYLDSHAKLMPQRWVRRLMEATARTEYGVEPGQASAIELVYNLPVVKGSQIEVLGASDERYLIEGGSGALPAAMAKRLAGHITTARAVTRIDPQGSGVRLSFASGAPVAADAVIVATPAGVTKRIAFGMPLPPLWRRFLDEVNLGRNGKVQMVTATRPWEARIGRGGEIWQTDPGLGVALGWDGTVRPSSDPGNIWTWFLGGAELDTHDPVVPLARRFATQAEPAVPGMVKAMTGHAVMTTWHQEPYTMGGYINFRPGQLTRFAPLIWSEGGRGRSLPLSAGRIVFAGEHLSDAFPGYMNGGAQTGRLAAQAILAQHADARRAA